MNLKKSRILSIIFIFLFSFTCLSSDFKVQFEVFSSYGLPSLKDLNTEIEFREAIFKYDFDYKYLEESGKILDLEQNLSLGYENINFIIPFGERIRFIFSEHFSVSVGIEYASKEKTFNSTASLRYKYPSSIDVTENDEEEFTPYVRMVMPSLIFHISPFKYRIKESFYGDIEIYLGGGPIFGRVEFERNNQWGFNISNFGEMDSMQVIHNEGTGTGFGALSGIRLNFYTTKNIGFFVGAHYLYGKINRISGKSYFISAGRSEGRIVYIDLFSSWEGDWFVASSEFIRSYKDPIKLEFVSNNPDVLDDKVRDFSLDFSGVYLGIGFFITF